MMDGAGTSQRQSVRLRGGKLASSYVIEVFIGISTVFLSVGTSAFVGGMRWGKINEEITSIDRRLAKIEGMFTLTLKDNSGGN